MVMEPLFHKELHNLADGPVCCFWIQFLLFYTGRSETYNIIIIIIIIIIIVIVIVTVVVIRIIILIVNTYFNTDLAFVNPLF